MDKEKKVSANGEISIQKRSADSVPGREEVVEICAQLGDVLVGLNAGGAPLEAEL